MAKRKKKLKKDEKYLICWHDAYSSNGWSDKKEILEAMERGFKIETVGFYVGEENGYMAFAQDVKRIEMGRSHGKYGNVFAVPGTWIESIKELP